MRYPNGTAEQMLETLKRTSTENQRKLAESRRRRALIETATNDQPEVRQEDEEKTTATTPEKGS